LQSYNFSKTANSGGCSWSPLHFAALEGNLEMIRYFVRDGIPVDVGTTAAHLAISANKGLTPAAVAVLFLEESKAITVCVSLLVSEQTSSEPTAKDLLCYMWLPRVVTGRGYVRFYLMAP